MTDRLKMKIEDMDITPDELNRFTEAFKKEEFRKLFAEYAEEISNPENRKIYEKELEQLENERGVDVTFIHPEPGFVIKTTQNGDQKCFINICKNVNVQKPKSDVTNEKQTDGSTRKGITWSIPHSCAPPKEDLDKSGKRCVVYDVVFHPDSYRMGETNQRFKDLLKDTACETIEKNFNAKLDRKNMKILKMPFKGTPTATVVRRPKSNTDNKFNPKDQTDPLNGIKTPYSYPPTQQLIREQKTVVIDDDKRPIAKQVEIKRENSDEETQFTKPKYTIINRGRSDLQDCVNDRQHTQVGSLRPKEICIEIDLPLCKNVSNVKLDIYEKHLHLESQKPYYRLDIDLPYPVNENDGNAKFDKAKKMLSVTLPVLPFQQNIDERCLPVDDQANTQSNLTSHDKSSEVQVTGPVSEGSDLTSSQQQHHLTNSSNDEVSVKPINNEINPISNEPQNPTTNGISQHVKYNLPEKYILKQNSKMFKLIFCAVNINSKSFDVTFDPSSIFIKYECIGSGGYATHSSIYIKFQKDLIRSQQAPAPTNHQSKMMEICFEKLDKYCIIEKADVALNPYDSKITAMDIDSCEEEELKEILATIDCDTSANTTKVNVNVTCASSEKFTLSMSNELDEDDDQNASVDCVQEINKPNNSVSESNITEEDNRSDKGDLENDNRFQIVSTNALPLKGILKKPRSLSESESQTRGEHGLRSADGSESSVDSSTSGMTYSQNSSGESINEQKKSVKFNNQIRRTVFKSGSAVADLKKSNNNKNRKRNQRRKRTTSEPSDLTHTAKNVRERSISESSDDGKHQSSDNDNDPSNANSNSEEELNMEHDEMCLHVDNDQAEETKTSDANLKISDKSKKDDKTTIVETMLSWKPVDTNNNQKSTSEFVEKTKCAFKFSNSIICELDD